MIHKASVRNVREKIVWMYTWLIFSMQKVLHSWICYVSVFLNPSNYIFSSFSEMIGQNLAAYAKLTNTSLIECSEK